jgi:stalled ribosome rescue protein Dom34
MTATKRIAIWMDHSSARLIEFPPSLMEEIITSKFTHEEKEISLSKSENLMHNKEQHERASFYKQLGEVIKNYEEVLLFGPTEAKQELYNILKEDHLFENIKIDIKQADKLTDNQLQAFVKAYFSK